MTLTPADPAAPAFPPSTGPARFARLSDLLAFVGRPLASSDWIRVDQARIDAFARTTEDEQWIHVDPIRAAAGPFGAPIAHGFLTLSLLPRMLGTALRIDDVVMGVNYGVNRVRFPAPVPVDSELRGHLRLLAHEPLPGAQGAQLVIEVTVERRGSARPVCVAESVTRHHVAA